MTDKSDSQIAKEALMHSSAFDAVYGANAVSASTMWSDGYAQQVYGMYMWEKRLIIRKALELLANRDEYKLTPEKTPPFIAEPLLGCSPGPSGCACTGRCRMTKSQWYAKNGLNKTLKDKEDTLLSDAHKAALGQMMGDHGQ